MLAIRPDRRPGLPVRRPPRVIVRHHRRVEIQHIHRPVRPRRHIHRTKPVIPRPHPFAPTNHRLARITRSLRPQLLAMHHIKNRLGAPDRTRPLVRPSPALIHHRRTRRTVMPHSPYLHQRCPLRQILALHRPPRIHRTHRPNLHPRRLRHHPLRQHQMLQRIPTRRHPQKTLQITRHLQPERIPAHRRHLLNRTPIRPKPDHPRRKARHRCLLPRPRRLPTRPARRIHPPIRRHHQVIQHKMIRKRNIPEQRLHRLRSPVAILVPDP